MNQARGEARAIVSLGRSEGLPGSGEQASDRIGAGGRHRGVETEAEEEGIGNGADREDAAGVLATKFKGFTEWFRVAVGFDATGFEFAEETGFASILPIATDDELVVGNGIEVPLVGVERRCGVRSAHRTLWINKHIPGQTEGDLKPIWEKGDLESECGRSSLKNGACQPIVRFCSLKASSFHLH